MTTRATIALTLLLYSLICATSAWTEETNAISMGSTTNEVMKVLGTPKGNAKVGKRIIWTYDKGTVEFENGKVVTSSFLSDEAYSRQRAQRAKWAEDRQKSEEKQTISAPQCIESYKQGILSGDLNRIATCLVPPMDDSIRAIGELCSAIQKWTDAATKAGINASNVDKLRKVFDPYSAYSMFEYTNLTVEGVTATAEVSTVMFGQKRTYAQKLAELDGKWYIVQQSGSPRYSDADAEKIRQGAALTRDAAKSAQEQTARLISGTLKPQEAPQELAAVLKKLTDKLLSEPTTSKSPF
jgi:hypothetical protein